LALKHKKDLAQLISLTQAVSLRQGLSIGAVWLIFDIAKQLGITETLGHSRQGKLALWQVIARVIDQGSRQSRDSKLASLRQRVKKQNDYLAKHPRAREAVALKKVKDQCEKLKVSKWVEAKASDRKISLTTEQDVLAEIEKLDGCYVLKTDLPKKVADKKTIHSRYKDLAQVEWAFRTSKTVPLEMRPVHVRLASRTRGHVFVVMPAYRMVKELAGRWNEINLTVAEGIDELATLCTTEIRVNGKPRCHKIPQPRPSIEQLLKAAAVHLPEILPCKGTRVASRKKLPENRLTP